MTCKAIVTDEAPKAIGPYSQAVIADGIVYSSGQVAINPDSGRIEADDIETQTHQVLKNLEAVLRKSGSSFKHVTKSTIYIIDMSDFPKVNSIYAEYFGDQPPARSTVQVAALPLGALVEIDMIALVSDECKTRVV